MLRRRLRPARGAVFAGQVSIMVISRDSMQLRIYLLSLLTSGMALFLLIHFALIWVYGQVVVYESTTWVLAFETVMMVAVLGFSAFCLVDQLRFMGKRPRP